MTNAKHAYEGMPAYKAGYKDAVEEFRTFYKKHVVLNNPITSMQLINEQFKDMLASHNIRFKNLTKEGEAGYKKAVEEFRTFYDAYNMMNNTIIAMQLIDAQFEEMLKKV